MLRAIPAPLSRDADDYFTPRREADHHMQNGPIPAYTLLAESRLAPPALAEGELIHTRLSEHNAQ